MALTFVLSIDEMIYGRLMTTAARHIMAHIEDMPLFEEPTEETEANEDILKRFHEHEFGQRWRLLHLVIPKRLLMVITLLMLFTCKYYVQYCDRTEDGSWVSKPIYYPAEVPYNPLSFLYGYGLNYEEKPAWQMRVQEPARTGDHHRKEG